MSAKEFDVIFINGDRRTLFDGDLVGVEVFKLGFVDVGEDGVVVG